MPSGKKKNRNVQNRASQQGGGKKKKSNRPRGSPSSGSAASTQLVRAVCALTDPFCEASRGVRFPDYTSQPTVPFHVEDVFTIVSDSNGVKGVVVFPGFPYPVLNGTIASGTWTGTTAYNTYSNITTTFANNNVYKFRCVNFGVHIVPIAASTANSGFIMAQELTEMPAVSSTLSSPTTSGGKCALMSAKSGGMTWVSQPAGPGAMNFETVGTTTSTPSNTQDWTSLFIQVSGAPASTSMFAVRIVANFELVMDPQNAVNSIAVSTPPSPLLTSAAGSVRSSVGSFLAGGAEEFRKRIHGAATKILYRAGGAAVGALFGGAPGAVMGSQIPSIIDVD